jgi:hypothetical protein
MTFFSCSSSCASWVFEFKLYDFIVNELIRWEIEKSYFIVLGISGILVFYVCL